jgi:hypothetical protein
LSGQVSQVNNGRTTSRLVLASLSFVFDSRTRVSSLPALRQAYLAAQTARKLEAASQSRQRAMARVTFAGVDATAKAGVYTRSLLSST